MDGQAYADRPEAGRRLADAVADMDLQDPLVLALPRGGAPVAREVAAELDAPLDVLVVRKIGAPRNPEYALGAIGEGGTEVLDEEAMRRAGTTRADLEPTIEDERAELERRLQRYRGGRGGIDVAGRTVVVVDDGVATGRTAAAAAEVLRERGVARLVLAVPVGPPDSVEGMRERYDEVRVLRTPQPFRAIGGWYDRFDQTSDEEVVDVLQAFERS